VWARFALRKLNPLGGIAADFENLHNLQRLSFFLQNYFSFKASKFPVEIMVLLFQNKISVQRNHYYFEKVKPLFLPKIC